MAITKTDMEKAKKAASKQFPDSTFRGVEPPKPMPFTLSATKNVAEYQTETVTATGGTRTITFSGQTTGNIAYNANAATITSALEALSNIAPSDVVVEQVINGAIITNVYRFAGVYANKNVPLMTVGVGSLTGGSSSIAKTGTSMEEIIAREETRKALASAGALRSPSVVSNDIEKLSVRKPKDIGEVGRIPGEDY